MFIYTSMMMALIILCSYVYICVSTSTCYIDQPIQTTVLLDSTTYPSQHSIPGFQFLDKDGIHYPIYRNNKLVGNESLSWRSSQSTVCGGPNYFLCYSFLGYTINYTRENNWLFSRILVTNFSRVSVEILCDVPILTNTNNCTQSFSIYFYEIEEDSYTTDSQISINTSEIHLENFIPVNSILITNSSVTATFTKNSSRFVIGLKNIGFCVTINKILIYAYNECQKSTFSDNFDILPATLVPSIDWINVTIKCSNIKSINIMSKTARCYSNTSWVVDVKPVCECLGGYAFPNCDPCEPRTYKSDISNDKCKFCPKNSQSNSAALNCTCVTNYYTSPKDNISMPCGQIPSAPRSPEIINNYPNNATLTLEWIKEFNNSDRRVWYEIEYYSIAMPSSVTIISNITNLNYRFTNELLESTEYLFKISSLSILNEVAEVKNSISLNAITSFPKIFAVKFNLTTKTLKWNFTLSPLKPLVFLLNYTDNSSNTRHIEIHNCTCENSNCYCEISLTNLKFNTRMYLSLAIFSTYSYIFPYPIFNQPSTSNTTVNYTPTSLQYKTPLIIIKVIIIISVIIVIVIIIVVLLVCIVLFLCCCVRNTKTKNSQNIRYSRHLDTTDIVTPVIDSFTDPQIFDNLNIAIAKFAKRISHKNLIIGESVAAGEFGDISHGKLKCRGHDVDVAVKTLKQTATLKTRDDFLKEATIMGQFNNPNIIFLYGVTLSHPICIITPFMVHGALDQYLRKNKEYLKSDRDHCLKFALGIASGMNYLTDLGFIHRDLAARNVLVDSDLSPKIIDFGLSRELGDDFYNIRGGRIPVKWTAPEVIEYKRYSHAADVWSYGVLLWEIMTFGNLPYEELDNFELLTVIKDGLRLKQPFECAQNVYNLMTSCWNDNPELRPKFSDIKSSLFEFLCINGQIKNPSKIHLYQNFPHHLMTINEWLDCMKLSFYSENFHENGYCYLAQVWQLSSLDLERIGIENAIHRQTLMYSINSSRNILKSQSEPNSKFLSK